MRSLKRLSAAPGRSPSPVPWYVVARIEDQAKPLRVGHAEQRGDLVRRFHVAGAVMMKDRAQARFVEHRARNPDSAPPAKVFHSALLSPVSAVTRPGILVRAGSVPLSSASTRNGAGVVATAASRRAVFTAACHALGMSSGILHRHGHKRAQHHQDCAS
jgi:hypothetical protein